MICFFRIKSTQKLQTKRYGVWFALSLQHLATPLPFMTESARPPRYTCITFVRSPRSIDPGGISPTLRLRSVLAAYGEEEHIGFHSIYITGLNRFTLSHCGSRTPMPTLKPHLTASAPRLGTDCSLNFTGSGLSPNYITRTELAHPHRVIIPYFCLGKLLDAPGINNAH